MRQWMIAAVAVTGLTLTMGAQGVAHAQGQGNNGTMQGERQMGSAGPGQGPRDRMQAPFEGESGASVVTLPTPGWGSDNQGTGGSGTGVGGGGTGGSGMLSTDTMQEKGIIRSVSDKGMTISVPKKNRIVTLRVDDQVQLLRDDQPLALSSLQVGDEVRATYQFNEDGEKVLRGLEVTKERAEQAKKKK
ncbi:hypothetical protein D187_007158 [Cystobacter fuscus DSM 2262]|uniref:DUF5666 domain-containing protein n=1 Tax=Cystobacter fuscus (strain ATCC 25194 / DSM 2262 / NBRC 100088 / M29) TaxID=1242864 RepID=S9Q7T7_CYSF2|nr:hypothetical protein [Cystobacter fuscus]EPX57404.1 hypothetical protein D187_007158 [Cystobacter fuscus DSM 2262]